MAISGHDWHYPAPVPDGVVLGDRVWLSSSFVFIHHRSERRPSIRVGSDSGIYHGTYFDLGPQAQVRIGDYCSIQGTVISTAGEVTIGDYTFIAAGTVRADRGEPVP